MNVKPILIATLLRFTTACKSQAAPPTVTATLFPIETPLPTATAASTATETPSPSETPSPIPTPSDVFGAIPLNSVQAFSLEPIAQAIFEQTLQGMSPQSRYRNIVWIALPFSHPATGN